MNSGRRPRKSSSIHALMPGYAVRESPGGCLEIRMNKVDALEATWSASLRVYVAVQYVRVAVGTLFRESFMMT